MTRPVTYVWRFLEVCSDAKGSFHVYWIGYVDADNSARFGKR
jgi:hypothetical protein